MNRTNLGRDARNGKMEKGQNPKERLGNNTFTTPKMGLPVFLEENPREWLRKCQKLFQIHQVPECHSRCC